MNTTEIIVSGFIRLEFQNLFTNAFIVPIGILRTCCSFYLLPFTPIFVQQEIAYYHGKNNDPIEILNLKQKTTVKLIEAKAKTKASTLNKSSKKKKQSIYKDKNTENERKDISQCIKSSYCYIPNASSMMKILAQITQRDIDKKNISYDALAGVYDSQLAVSLKDVDSFRLKFIFFKSNILHKNIQNISQNYYSLNGTESLPNITNNNKHKIRLIYCDRFGIFYSYNYNLYQLKLSHIISDRFGFFKINTKNKKECWKHYTRDIKQRKTKLSQSSIFGAQYETVSQSEYLSMCYMKNYSRIAAIECIEPKEFDYSGNVNLYSISHSMRNLSAECGMFDLTSNKWIKISPIKFTSNLSSEHIEFNIINSSNIIYSLSTHGHIAEYDCNQNQWIILQNQLFLPKSQPITNSISTLIRRNQFGAKHPRIFIDNDNPNILYCSVGILTNYYYGSQGRTSFARFDKRAKTYTIMTKINKLLAPNYNRLSMVLC